MTAGIIGALPEELEFLIKKINNVSTEEISGIIYYRGILNNLNNENNTINVVVAVCGIGKVNAAMCAQTMIIKYSPNYIINVGVAGSLSNKLKTGDIVIADSVVQHDIDTTPLSPPLGFIHTVNQVYIKCSEKLNSILAEIDGGIKFGIIATGDQFIKDAEKVDFIAGNFGAIAAEMEGGSIGQVCYLNNIEFTVIRAISDNADSDSSADFVINLKSAAKKAVDLVLELLLR